MVGSSRNRTRGRWSSAATSSHFMRSPSESWRVGCSTSVAELEQLGQLGQRLVELAAWARRRSRGSCAKVSTGGRSQRSCCFCPITSVMRSRKSSSRRRGSKPSTRTVPARRVEQAREHLQRRGLAGAVRAEEADALAGVDGERQLVDGAHGRVLAMEERAHRGPGAGGALVDAVLLDQLVDLDLRRHPIRS